MHKAVFVAFWLFTGLISPHHVNTINSIAKYMATFSKRKKRLKAADIMKFSHYLHN